MPAFQTIDMKRNPFNRINGLYFLLLLTCLSCKKDLEKPQWDTQILAPFAYTEMGIENIVKNGSAQTNPDHSIDLFIRDTLYALQLDSIVSVVTPTFDINKTLDSIKFGTDPIVTKITLGQIAKQMAMSSDPTTAAGGNFILSSNGTTQPFVPAISNITGGPIPINISTILDEAEIKTGFLDISITNGLPLAIQRVELEIKNAKTPFAVVAQPVITSIAVNATKTQTEDISGKHVDGTMNGNILDMDFAAGFGVYIDTSDAVTVTLNVRDVTVTSAVAIFPAQNVVNDKSVNYLLDMGSVKLKEMKMKSGFVKIEVSSTIPDSIFFSYSIPTAIKDGVPFKTDTKVPPAGGTTVFTYDMTGYTMGLRGDPAINTDYNGLYNELVGRIKYTGHKIPLALTDFIHVKISLENAKPSYVEGYLGDTTVNINGSIPLTVFKNITGGTLQFENADVAVVVDNSFGVPGSATISNITAHNGAASASSSSGTVALGPGINGNPPVITSSRVNVTNATPLVNILPKSVDYAGSLQINPSGAFNDNQFAYAAYPVKAYLEFKMPLSLIANQLQLTDTILISSAPQLNSALKKGKLNLITDNGFPFDAKVIAYFLDGSGTMLDSLVTTQYVERAPKGSDGKVTQPKRSIISYDLSAGTISNIQKATSVIFKASFSTDTGSYSKVYSDYRIKFKLAGDIQYTVNAQ
ncbi:MAG: hypothetical protein JWM14_201 [Chitinophagaceae bacterium]|nr:hypothetical protein [Chitinophagaceae bacterium]